MIFRYFGLVLAVMLMSACICACDPETAEVHQAAVTRGTGGTEMCNEPAGLCYRTNMTQTGDYFSVRLNVADPGPPVRGDQNIWMVTILDESGSPSPCAISVDAIMPDHGHGTTPVPEAKALDDLGTFEIAPLNLFMPGLWEVIFDLECGEREDRVVYAFWIES